MKREGERIVVWPFPPQEEPPSPSRSCEGRRVVHGWGGANGVCSMGWNGVRGCSNGGYGLMSESMWPCAVEIMSVVVTRQVAVAKEEGVGLVLNGASAMHPCVQRDLVTAERDNGRPDTMGPARLAPHRVAEEMSFLFFSFPTCFTLFSGSYN
ncbi:hypothetical protein CEXT_807761 [Caerostris extrusa]|uniref:Uncharacterized protein n=1 Tax=Caerostris extrusa TaxID=172846 RepID=A0AAV4V7I3_CAEEX|nr:hypothetical protein CEXT_807761 [Caerostris extrusa]